MLEQELVILLRMPFERNLSPETAPLASELKFRLRLSLPFHWRWLADRLGDRYLDRKFGIVSSERRSLVQLGLEVPDCTDYQPVSYSDFHALLKRISIGSDDVFLDYGSGMGRALCLAALYPFRSVIGVEMSAELCAIAGRNIDRVRHKLRCQDVRVANVNAVDYEIPSEVSVIYFFNPFGGSVLAKVLTNIAASLHAVPRRLVILFCGTASSEAFRLEARTQRWLDLRSQIMLPTGTVGLIYENSDRAILEDYSHGD